MTTIISDEAVNIALNTWLGGVPAWRNDATERLRTDMCAALTAALPFLPVQVAVKKLEWFVTANGDIASDSIVGWYRLHMVVANTCYRLETPGGFIEYKSPYSHWPESEAKSAAQADYEARILSALEPSAARELALGEALTETRTDLVILQGNVADAARTDSRWEGMYERVGSWIKRIDAALSSPDHADAGKVEGDGWRPIETAPKDGTIVLLGWNDPDIEEIGAVAGWYEGGPSDKCWYDQYHEPVTATHWMPLRPLPSAPSEGAE